ncbi:haloacid dehalogenase [Actinorhabdospora filicis]|uniref:Haloacid dehalogenase n=1 Tax=Actinorhabdospora filicis TaxID=1785913 RepID=A0A9W6W8B3_9ACTN|nr:HAD hydrolase family protein [Actinorhabdospora filicis]GLZ75485.1 haloacid dehalogenase [Actinorhabdospora filicis]
MTSPRLIATDLDGTLLRADHTLSPRTIAALRAARAAGTLVAAVTARPPRALADMGLAAHCDLAICANGALVHDLAADRVVSTRALTVPTARKAAEAVAAVVPGVGFGVETGFEVVAGPGYTRRDSVGDSTRHVRAIDDVWATAHPIVKLLAHSTAHHADDMLAAALAVAPPDVVVSHSGGRGLLEISAAGVTKATTLAALCAEHGLTPADVIAFGDMPNDIPMLEWAGRGYAMGDAHPDVRAATVHHAPACAEDGVAAVLETLY